MDVRLEVLQIGSRRWSGATPIFSRSDGSIANGARRHLSKEHGADGRSVAPATFQKPTESRILNSTSAI